jgi:Mg2+-importing ATPase
VFGLGSSLFDYVTFGVLLLVAASPGEFRTGWFTESVLSEVFVLLSIRTAQPAIRSAPGPLLLWSSVAVTGLTLMLPYSPLAGPLGLAPMPADLLVMVGAIVAAYFLWSEVGKRMTMFRPRLREVGPRPRP